ncbi:T7SS effector LXG polymorphic toxin [Pseudogracilibacillus auburnensis]|uniref:T7SS effector LXG polymorphic toxin n=1 Tax=Pseudogracilibacillus auburnensis TaxID=1494959 RepID=UPI001A969CAB|nr:T7SS effector LXG polymorphic toxin [Pseudogracilibacillus auburnensis]MBO1001792.1 hypothetical protein [Pseudogracilibacillus auburnensis]
MSLNMYLGETDAQRNSANAICIEIIQSMEKTMSSISSFTFAFTLQGETYRSAKEFMAQTYFPLAQGIIYLCEELIRQNDKYPHDFRSQVATTDVIEQEIVAQINEIDRMITSFEALNEITPIFRISILIYKNMKRKLQEKLENLYAFNSSSGGNYDTAMQLAQNVMLGLSQIQGGKGFNSKTGVFSTAGMDLSWVVKLDEIHYTRKAKDKYGDYLKEYPEDIEKIITIIKYEERNTEYIEQSDEFLSQLEQKDAVEIKYLMYSAEEPYRILALQYLGELELILVEIDPNDEEGPGPSFFDPNDNSITYVFERDRANDRGAYFTFFHELGHAIDYNYGIENGMDGYYSDYYKSLKKTLAEHMHGDVESRIRAELKNELNKAGYDNLDAKGKTSIINNVARVAIHKGPSSDIDLTNVEEDLFEKIQIQLSGELYTDEYHNVSDVYGGVTLNEILGKWGHHELDYWINEETRERTNEPNKEGFASYYGSIMLQDSEFRNKQIDSVNEYLPNSKQHMDDMFDKINKGGNE